MGAAGSAQQGAARLDDDAEYQAAPQPALSSEQIRDLIGRGLRPDLALLPFQMPRMDHDGIPPPPIDMETTRVKNDMNIHKKSIALTAAGELSQSSVRVTFTFDAVVPCKITIHFVASDEGGTLSNLDGSAPYVAHCEPGLDQAFTSPVEFDLNAYPATSLVHVPYSSKYPLIIRMSRSTWTAREGHGKVVDSQTTYATFVQTGPAPTYAVKVVKQSVDVGGRRFDVEEIFGLEQGECVVCMSAASNTALLPCKHCIVCSQCAEILRVQTAKCPMCRSGMSMSNLRPGIHLTSPVPHSCLQAAQDPPGCLTCYIFANVLTVVLCSSTVHRNAVTPRWSPGRPSSQCQSPAAPRRLRLWAQTCSCPRVWTASRRCHQTCSAP